MASQVDAIGFHFRIEDLVENPVAFMSNDFHLFGMDKLPFYSPKQSHVTSFISSHSKYAGRKSNYIQPYGGVFRSHKFNSSFFQAEIPNHAQISPDEGANESLPLHSSTDLPFVEDTLGDLLYGPVSALPVPNKPNKIIYPTITYAGAGTSNTGSPQKDTPNFVSPAEMASEMENPDLTETVLKEAAIAMRSLSDKDLMVKAATAVNYVQEDAKRQGDHASGPPPKKEKHGDDDYDRLRRQLSQERELHREEVRDIRENFQRQVTSFLKEKEETATKERDLRHLMMTNMDSTYQMQMATMMTSHQATACFLQKTIDELNKAHSVESSSQALVGDPKQEKELQRVTKELEEMQNLLDSKDTINDQLVADNQELTAKIEELKLQAIQHADMRDSLNTKIAAGKATEASLSGQLTDADNVATSLRATIASLEKGTKAMDEKKLKMKKHLDNMVQQIADLQASNDRLLAVENQFKSLQQQPDKMTDLADVLQEHQQQLAKTEANLKEKVVELYDLNDKNRVLSRQNRDLENDIIDLQSQVDNVNGKLTREVEERLALLESHRLEKKALRQQIEPSPDAIVAFEREPFSNSVEDSPTGSTPDPNLNGDKSLSLAGGIRPGSNGMVHKEDEKTAFPVYDSSTRFSRTDPDVKEELSQEALEEQIEAESIVEPEKAKETGDTKGWTTICKNGRRSGDERDFKSPSPRRRRDKGDQRSRRDSRSRSQYSKERSSSKRQDLSEVEEAAKNWEEIKRKVNSYQTYLEERVPEFKDMMRSEAKTEDEKFRRIEHCLTELFKSESFKDLKAFIKGKEVIRRTTRVPKGALPDLREGSVEWKLMTTWPQGQTKKRDALVHFNQTIVVFRPYCEPFYKMITTLIAAGNEHKNATNILFTKQYEGDNAVERSIEERKFDLLLVVAMAKTVFALNDGREVGGIRRERIRCKAKAYTKDWAVELSEMLSNDVNHAQLNALMPLYVETPDAAAAVSAYYKELAQLKEKTAGQGGWFNPFQEH